MRIFLLIVRVDGEKTLVIDQQHDETSLLTIESMGKETLQLTNIMRLLLLIIRIDRERALGNYGYDGNPLLIIRVERERAFTIDQHDEISPIDSQS